MSSEEIKPRKKITITELASMSGLPPDITHLLVTKKIIPPIKENNDIIWLSAIGKIIKDPYLFSSMCQNQNVYLKTASFLFNNFSHIELYAATIILKKNRLKQRVITGYIVEKLIITFGIDEHSAKAVVRKIYNSLSNLRRQGSIALEIIEAVTKREN
jgi:hypothetical protein